MWLVGGESSVGFRENFGVFADISGRQTGDRSGVIAEEGLPIRRPSLQTLYGAGGTISITTVLL